MRSTFLPFSPPCITEEERSAVNDVLNSDWITTGPKVREFEEKCKNWMKPPGVAAMNSWTSCAHSCLVAHGISQGDEVITTPLTFCATVNIIEHCGARPILADVDPVTLNIDVRKVESLITENTRMVIPVHYAGHPVDLDPLLEICRSKEIIVLEDAAHAISAKYKDRLIGSGSNPCAFSFYATKNLTTAEGGLLTGEEELIAKAKIIGLHGMSRHAWNRYDKAGSWKYDVAAPGYKYNMTDISAALGIVQLKRMPEMQDRRRKIAKMYNNGFEAHKALTLPAEQAHVEHAWHLYPLRLNLETLRIDRDRFIQELIERNIGCSVHFIPIHIHSFYKDKYKFKPDDYPIAYNEYLRLVSLPLHPRLNDNDVQSVIETVNQICNDFER
jgi:dTDP-4-amino-4,6-dideoxygalactose transaminase